MFHNINIYYYLKTSPQPTVPKEGRKQNLGHAPGECRKEAVICPKKICNFFMVHLPKMFKDAGEIVPEYF